jgi:hypothetical protein
MKLSVTNLSLVFAAGALDGLLNSVAVWFFTMRSGAWRPAAG